MTQQDTYHVVIVNPRGPKSGVMSRSMKIDKQAAIDLAQQRIKDWPDAECVRVFGENALFIGEYTNV